MLQDVEDYDNLENSPLSMIASLCSSKQAKVLRRNAPKCLCMLGLQTKMCTFCMEKS